MGGGIDASVCTDSRLCPPSPLTGSWAIVRTERCSTHFPIPPSVLLPGECLNEHANFRRFPPALLLLVRMATGENWNCIMHDCSVRPPHDCTIYEDGRSDCGEVWAPAFFVIFVVCACALLRQLQPPPPHAPCGGVTRQWPVTGRSVDVGMASG